jgi:hypothetical protein
MRATLRLRVDSSISRNFASSAGLSVPGQPAAEARFVILPRDQIVVHDNWQVAGLSGSGSSDYSIQNQFVPEDMSFPFGELICGEGCYWRRRIQARHAGLRRLIPHRDSARNCPARVG